MNKKHFLYPKLALFWKSLYWELNRPFSRSSVVMISSLVGSITNNTQKGIYGIAQIFHFLHFHIVFFETLPFLLKVTSMSIKPAKQLSIWSPKIYLWSYRATKSLSLPFILVGCKQTWVDQLRHSQLRRVQKKWYRLWAKWHQSTRAISWALTTLKYLGREAWLASSETNIIKHLEWSQVDLLCIQ